MGDEQRIVFDHCGGKRYLRRRTWMGELLQTVRVKIDDAGYEIDALPQIELLRLWLRLRSHRGNHALGDMHPPAALLATLDECATGA
jgi:hypothetical protein